MLPGASLAEMAQSCTYHGDLMTVIELQIGQVAQLLGALARRIRLVGSFSRVHVGLRRYIRSSGYDNRGARIVDATLNGLQRI